MISMNPVSGKQLPANEYQMSQSRLAMKAARKMVKSRNKEKTGKIVCHHLLKMLDVEQALARQAHQRKQQYKLEI